MKFEIYPQDDPTYAELAQWRWRLKAKNGRIVADSGEAYSSERAVRRAITRLQDSFRFALLYRRRTRRAYSQRCSGGFEMTQLLSDTELVARLFGEAGVFRLAYSAALASNWHEKRDEIKEIEAALRARLSQSEGLVERVAEAICDFLDERFPEGALPGGVQLFADDHLDAEFKHEAGCAALAERIVAALSAPVKL